MLCFVVCVSKSERACWRVRVCVFVCLSESVCVCVIDVCFGCRNYVLSGRSRTTHLVSDLVLSYITICFAVYVVAIYLLFLLLLWLFCCSFCCYCFC